MDDIQKEIIKYIRDGQQKYVYYILALTVSAMGFAIYRTTGQPLKLIQIPLGLAVLSWGFSVFCGLKFLKYFISVLRANHAHFEIAAGRHPDVKDKPHLIAAGVKGIEQAIDFNVKRGQFYFNTQSNLFYVGIFLFVVSHVLEMYAKT